MFGSPAMGPKTQNWYKIMSRLLFCQDATLAPKAWREVSHSEIIVKPFFNYFFCQSPERGDADRNMPDPSFGLIMIFKAHEERRL